jgi:D-lactate dehydrogenase
MINLLKKVPCFLSLDDATLKLLEEVVEPSVFKAGDVLCHEGETGDRMFIISSGEVAVLKSVEGGGAVEVAILKTGDIAGELGLFGQKTRTASLKAKNNCKTYTLEYNIFEAFLETHGSIAKGMLNYVSGHLARETSIVAKLMSKDMEKELRVAFFHTTSYRNELYQEYNQYNWALHFFTPRLTLDTVSLAAGFRVIVVSANDTLDLPVINDLYHLGV